MVVCWFFFSVEISAPLGAIKLCNLVLISKDVPFLSSILSTAKRLFGSISLLAFLSQYQEETEKNHGNKRHFTVCPFLLSISIIFCGWPHVNGADFCQTCFFCHHYHFPCLLLLHKVTKYHLAPPKVSKILTKFTFPYQN